MEELEARLYSQVYHDTKIEETPEAVDNLPPNLNLQSNKRYWQKSKNLSTQNVVSFRINCRSCQFLNCSYFRITTP